MTKGKNRVESSHRSFKASEIYGKKGKKEKPAKKLKPKTAIDVLRKKPSQEQLKLIIDAFRSKNPDDLRVAEELLKDIPASKLLREGTLEQLQQLFLDDDSKVDFHGNAGAVYRIGLGDLFPASQEFVKVIYDDGSSAIGKRSSTGNKVGYLNKEGRYIPIWGGENVSTKVSNEEIKGFDHIHTAKDEDEKVLKDRYLGKIEEDEKAEKQTIEEINKILDEPDGAQKITLSSRPTKGQFKAVMERLAKIVGEAYNIPWQVIVAQAALESGYGKYALNKNYFGIKTGKKWRGRKSSFATREWEKGRYITIDDSFRGYGSVYESVLGYARFLHNNSRYSNALEQYKKSNKEGKDAQIFLKNVKKAGYATDPFYVSKANKAFKMLYGAKMQYLS